MNLVIYNFYTENVLKAPIEKVWSILEDAESWPKWSRGFKKIEILGPEGKIQNGSVLDCEVKGSLPYSLRFKLEVTSTNSPKSMTYNADGHLRGTGKWELEETDKGTVIKYWWDVGMTNPFFNFISKIGFIKKAMEKNHDRVMEQGHINLQHQLDQM